MALEISKNRHKIGLHPDDCVWLEIYWYYFFRNLSVFCSLWPHPRYMTRFGKQMTVLRTRLVNLYQEITESKCLFWFTALHAFITNLVALSAPCVSAYVTWHVMITQRTCALYINTFTTSWVLFVVVYFLFLLYRVFFVDSCDIFNRFSHIFVVRACSLIVNYQTVHISIWVFMIWYLYFSECRSPQITIWYIRVTQPRSVLESSCKSI